MEQRRQVLSNPMILKKIKEEIEMLKNGNSISKPDKKHKKDKKKHHKRSRSRDRHESSEDRI